MNQTILYSSFSRHAQTCFQLKHTFYAYGELLATNNWYHCVGTVNVGRADQNTGYRICVAYRTGNPRLGDYGRRVPECEITSA
jgi:hypothetical protein